MSRFGDQHFSIPADDAAPQELSLAFSLVGARRGEIVPVDAAGVAVPRSQGEIRQAGAVFRRVKVTHRWRTSYTNEAEVIDAWLRI